MAGLVQDATALASSANMWAVGCIVFEMIFGTAPPACGRLLFEYAQLSVALHADAGLRVDAVLRLGCSLSSQTSAVASVLAPQHRSPR